MQFVNECHNTNYTKFAFVIEYPAELDATLRSLNYCYFLKNVFNVGQIVMVFSVGFILLRRCRIDTILVSISKARYVIMRGHNSSCFHGQV